MATTTAAATGVGASDSWGVVGGVDKWIAVNTPDDDGTTYIRTFANNAQQSFTSSPAAIASGDTVTAVEIVYRGGGFHESGNSRVVFGYSFDIDGGSSQSGESGNITWTNNATYQDGSVTFSGLSAAWGGNLVFYVRTTQFYQPRVTTLYAVVTYTPAAAPARPALYYTRMRTA